MKFRIRNYRAISTADIELSKITMIAGKNAAGKTSLIDAIRSVLACNPNPFSDVTKKEMSMLVHSGTPSGYVEVIDGENKGRIDYPKAEYSAVGTPPALSTISSGIDSLVDYKTNDRINFVVDMMQALPTKAELEKELADNNIIPSGDNSKYFVKIWEEITLNGWNNAYKKAKEMGVKLKAKWEYITGQKKWGIRVGEQYQPAAWSPELEKIPEEKLIEELNEAKEWYEAAAKDVAISAFEVERLTAICNNTADVKKKYDNIVKQQNVVDKELASKKAALRMMEGTREIRNLVCPSCNEKLTLTNGELKKIPEEKYKKAQKGKEEIEQLKKNIESLQAQNNRLLKSFGEEKAALKVCEESKKKLSAIEKNKTRANDADIEKAKSKLTLAQERYDAYKLYKEAQSVHNNIVRNQKLCNILSPDGIRNKKLTKAYATINNSMKMITDQAGWKPVEINNNCQILSGGVPYGRLIAKSERYRTRILLQLMVATKLKSRLVIIDDTDELTPSVRNDLIKILIKSDLNAIIVSAMDKKTDMPDLSKFSGLAYWIEGGTIS